MSAKSPVDALLADCRRVTEAIAEHRQAVTGLTAERDGMVRQLRVLGLPERAVGRLLGISGPRVNQITHPAQDTPGTADAGQAEYERQMAAAKRWESRPPAPAAKAARKPRKAPAVVPGSGTAGAPPVVLQPPEPEPVVRAKAPCKHPGVGKKQRCHECGAYNV